MSSSPLRAAIVGTGFIAGVHRDGLLRNGVEIVGVLGSTADRSREFADRWRLDQAYASIDELVADDDVDVVHITSPNDQHYSQALAVMRAGKHVVCEKPLANSSEETGMLVRVADETGVVNALNYNIRHYPQVREARERVESGLIGDVRLVTGEYFQDWLLHDTDWNWRADSSQGGALRAVADIGSHWLDLMAYVVGSPVVEVLAETATFIPVRKKPAQSTEAFRAGVGPVEDVQVTSDDAALVLLRFANGACGSVNVSQVSPGRKNGIRFEIAGSTASLAWRGERPDELWVGHRDEPNQVLLRDPALLSGPAAQMSRVPGGHAEGFENSFAALYAAVYAHISAGGVAAQPADYPDFAAGHTEALVLEAIESSARSGRWTAVSGFDRERIG